MRDGERVPRDALLAAAAFVVTAVTATVAWQLSGRAVTDIALYHAYGERIADGLVPYRDFAFEYPPGALPALAASKPSRWAPAGPREPHRVAPPRVRRSGERLFHRLP